MANPPLPTHIFVGAARSRSETRGGVFRQAIGDAYHGLGVYDQAITHLTHARDLRVQNVKKSSPGMVRSLPRRRTFALPIGTT